MDIIIKNVTGDPSNDWCILELKRAGFPAGSVIKNVKYESINKTCYWSSGSENCVAWVGETCVVKTIYFKTKIYREHTLSPIPEDLGMANCSMEMFLSEDGKSGQIEWIVEYEDGSEDVEHIGLCFENRCLIDFDGVFSLPEEAKKLIRCNGFHVSRDFD